MKTKAPCLTVIVMALACLALVRPAAANDVQVIDVRPRPATTGERTYYLASGATIEEAVAFRDRLIAAGAWNVNLFLPERVIVCEVTPAVAAAAGVPVGYRSEPAAFAQAPSSAAGESWGWIAEAYRQIDRTPAEQGTAAEASAVAAEPFDDIVFRVPPEKVREVQARMQRVMAEDPAAPRPQPARNLNQNSELLTGSILVNFIFPESGGGGDPDLFDWSNADMIQARVGTTGAFLAWQAWTQMEINTTFNRIEYTPTAYEPILHDATSDNVWIIDTMRGMGWATHTSDPFTALHEYNEAMRALYRTQWVVSSFIANARGVPNHRFGNGNANYTAYAYLGGPYMVEPFPAGLDPNNIGETLVFSKIVQHEIGHCFWTLDEYPGAPGVCGTTSGYLNYSNANISVVQLDGTELRCENLTPCIMHTWTRIGSERPWCRYSLGHLGVIDNNDNGYPDIFEAAPEIEFQPEGPETVSTNQFTLRFKARAGAVPNRNVAQDPGTRVDYAAPLGEVKLSLGANNGIDLDPVDGHMDEAVEEFVFPLSLPQAGQTAVVIRARNRVGFKSGDYVKQIFFTGVSYSRVGASVKTNRIDVTWETAGEAFGAKFDVYRLDPGEDLPGTKIATHVPAAGPGTGGFVPYRYIDRGVEPGHDYRYYVDGSFTLAFEDTTREYHSPSEVVGQTAGIPIVAGELVSSISPNPSTGNITVSVQVPRTYGGNPRAPQRLATPVEVTVYDVRGRRIRTLREAPALDDVLTLRWDGHSDTNLLVPAGVYFLRVKAGDTRAVRKVVLIR
ncbi:MAG TPA: T9SS type A sorting domain-containing protein [Candidatus Krumholzibacteria bacterium]|nr:T9SS type A sorting domain-containing protein [Candidatus Krumholzibacteria bacterium]